MMSLQRNPRDEQEGGSDSETDRDRREREASKAKHRLVDLHMQSIGSDQPLGRGRILA